LSARGCHSARLERDIFVALRIGGGRVEAIETWEVQKFDATMRWTAHMVRDRLRRGELMGAELARPAGAERWAPLVETSLYRAVFPEGSPRRRALVATLVPAWPLAVVGIGVLGWWGGPRLVGLAAAAWLVGRGFDVWRAWQLPTELPEPGLGDWQEMEVELASLRAAVSPAKLRDLERARARAEGPLADALDARLAAAREAASVAAELEAVRAATGHLEAAAELREAARVGRARVADAAARLRAVAEVG
jgi:hypothetical protein